MTRTSTVLRCLVALALALALLLPFAALSEGDDAGGKVDALIDEWIASVSGQEDDGNFYVVLSPILVIELIDDLLDLGLPAERVAARLEARGISLEINLHSPSEGE